MSFSSIDSSTHKHSHREKEPGKSRPNANKPRSTSSKRGCENCPLNHIHGIHKVFGKVRGRDIFIWAQSPGMQENKKRKELIGPSGKWLWEELKRVGITRDMCDIQNVVRCVPADINKHTWPPFKMRAPSKQEIKCCSLYTEEAVEKSKAKLHLVFGQVAGVAVLGKEFKKDKRVFYSDNLGGWVIFLDHPSYFIRQGFQAGVEKAPTTSLKRFRADLAQAKQLLRKKTGDRYGFLKAQHYIGIIHKKESKKAYRKLLAKAAKGIRIVADMEEGRINEKGEPDENGKSVALCCGFAYKPGTTYVFALAHPGTGISRSAYKTNLQHVQSLLSDSKVETVFHYGVSDTSAARRLLNTDVQGFNYDTLLAEYFRDANAKAYGLDAIATRRYPDFIDYKSMEGPESFTPAFIEMLKEKKYSKLSLPAQVMLGRNKRGALNLARMPWNKMVLYNGADCHLEKLVEQDTEKFVNPPLMQVYVDASHVLFRMQTDRKCMPLFDYGWHKKVSKLFNMREHVLSKKLHQIAGKYAYIKNKKTGLGEVRKKFNPGSPEQILWLLYEKLGYKFKGEHEDDKPNTRAGTLKTIGLRHPKANLVVAYRVINKAKGTYVKGYYKCAKLNEGYLRTNWKLTGTSTGRLSSGKTKDKSNDAVINFQNIHGDPLIKCLLVSDLRWRDLYEYWLKHGDFTEKTWKQFENYYIDLGFDFSQNELRELAEESGDKNLIAAFSSIKKWYCKKCKTEHGADPHVEVGHALTGWSREAIAHNDRVRKLVKNMQFGLVYGLQGEGLYQFLKALGVKTTRKEVDKYHAKYFRKFPGVKRLQEKYAAFAEKHNYVENRFGFRRKLNVEEQKELGDAWEGSYWKNQSMNTPIQGASHQLLLMSLAALHRYPEKYKMLQHPNKEIHDALYNRLKLKYLFKGIKLGKKLMLEEPVKIVKEDFHLKKRVPLSAKPKAGFRFGVNVEIGDNVKNEWEFLNEWCKENQKLVNDYKKQIKERSWKKIVKTVLEN